MESSVRPDQVVGQFSLAETLAHLLQESRKRELRKKISPYPRTVSILSDIGECDRQMVYAVTNWQDRPLHDEDLQARFDAGKEQETLIVRDLLALGYEVISGQEVVEIKNRAGETIARGKIDGKIRWQGYKIPFEIKSMNPNVFDGIDGIEDFQKKPYLRKYLRQLQAYLYGNNAEEGLLFCTDCLGHWKIFPLALDFGEAEAILQRLERVHAAIKAKTLPDRIEYREDTCGKCAFAQLCLADVVRTEMQILSDEEFLGNLHVRGTTQDAHRAYESSDKAVKEYVKKNKIVKGVAGEWIITSKTLETKERHVPAGTMTRIEISRLNGKGE